MASSHPIAAKKCASGSLDSIQGEMSGRSRAGGAAAEGAAIALVDELGAGHGVHVVEGGAAVDGAAVAGVSRGQGAGTRLAIPSLKNALLMRFRTKLNSFRCRHELNTGLSTFCSSALRQIWPGLTTFNRLKQSYSEVARPTLMAMVQKNIC